MNPNLEPPLYAAALTIFTAFLWLFPKRRFSLPRSVSTVVFILLGVVALLVEYIFFTTPLIQKQLVDFGLTSVEITPLSLLVSLAVLVIFTTIKIPSWIVTVTIVPLTFYVGQMASYDATHFIGPIHDLIKGLPPLSSPSWYGLLPVVGLSLIFRVVPLTLVNLYVVIAAVETLGYLLLYRFVLRLFNDTRWATLTIAFMILFHFLVQIVDRNFYLQSTFIRFGIWVPLAFAVTSKKQPIIIASLLAALFWTTDMGLYVVGSYLATLLITRKPLWPTIRVIAPFAFILALFRNYWAFSLSYGSIPMFATPIPHSIFPWLFLAIPVLTLLIAKNSIIIFLSLLSLFMFTYFTGHSHLNSLRTINLPIIIIALWWIQKIPRIAMALLLVIPIAVWGNQAMTNLKTGNILTTLRTIRRPPITEYTIVGPTALEIKKRYQSVLNSGDFAVVSPWDTYYLLIWNTTNKLGSNCLLCYWTPDAAKKLIYTMEHLEVSYVFVDKEHAGYERRVSWIFTPSVAKSYRFVETIGDLDVYERI